MKKMLLTLTAVAAFTGSAYAADLPARMPVKAAPPPLPVASWTGCYIGGGGGYGMYNEENTGYDNGAALGGRAAVRTQVTDTFTTGGRGWFGTVQGGCDYQFGLGTHQFVIGAFADYDFADIHGRRGDPMGTPPIIGAAFVPGLPAGVGNEKLSSSWSVGGRVGWVIVPQLLTYFSGGYSEAKFDATRYTTLFVPVGVPTGLYTQGSTFKGWFLGAGDEYALTFLPGLFWKTEARAYHYDRQTQFNYFNNTNILTGNSYDAEKWVYTVRSELVYRFNWGGPVVAKY